MTTSNDEHVCDYEGMRELARLLVDQDPVIVKNDMNRLPNRIDFRHERARALRDQHEQREQRLWSSVLLLVLLVMVFIFGFAIGAVHGEPVSSQLTRRTHASTQIPHSSATSNQPTARSTSNFTPQDKPKFSTEVEAALPCVQLVVRPQIMLPLTRADLRLEARIRRHPDHRQFSIAWDGGLAGAGGSAQSLHGEHEPFLHVRTLRNQPAAAWQFVAAVFNDKGKLTGRDVAAIQMPELGQ